MRLLLNVLLVTSLVTINHIRWIEADVGPGDRKINLEDIERDTLLNEIRSKSQETLQAEPTEHIPPSAATAPSHQQQQHVQHTNANGQPGGAVSHQTIVYHQTTGSGNHQESYSGENHGQHGAGGAQLQSGITYAQSGPQYSQAGPHQTIHYSHSAPSVAPASYVQHQIHSQPQIQQIHSQPQILAPQPVVYYSHNAHYPQEQVQYVTIQPPHHISHNLIAPQVPQVHEEGRTFSAPSRHSLEVNAQQQRHLKSQPQRPLTPVGFRPKQNLITPQPQYVYVQANNVASAQQQRQYQQKLQQAPPQKVQNVEIIQSQGQQIGQQIEYIPQQSGVTFAQATPYYQYSGSFGHQQAIPAHQPSLPANNYVVVPYATGPNVYQHQTGAPIAAPVVAPPQYEIPHYVNPTKQLVPNAAPQVLVQPPQHQSYVGPIAQYHSHPYAQQISYAPAHPGHSFGYQHHSSPAYSNYYQPTLDFFGGYARHTSLLDSYVPSNLIYSKSRQIYNQYYAHPAAAIAPSAPVAHHHQAHHQVPIETAPSPAVYNTIAYSTEQKPVVVAPPSQVAKRESTVLRAASAPKPTIATKVESGKITKQQ